MARTRRSTTEDPAAEPAAKRSKTDDDASGFAVGDALPAVELALQNEERVNLAEKHAKGLLVLYSYPKASTPGCTRQTSGFGSALADFQKMGAAVYGISADSPKSQATFKEKTGVEFDLLSDPEFALLEPLGAKKAPKSVVRSHFVFQDGKAVLVEHSVKPEESPKTTLAKVQELAESSGSDAKTNGSAGAGDEDEGDGDDDDEEEEAGDEDEDEEDDADFAAEADAQDDEEEDDGEYGSDEEAADEEEEAGDADADESGLKDEEVDEAEAQQVNEAESANQEAVAAKDEDDGANAKTE